MSKVFKIIKNGLTLLIFTSINFAAIFTLLNFGAVKETVKPYLFAAEMQQTENILNKTAGETEKKQDLLIPKGAKKLIKKQYPGFELEVYPTDHRLIIPKLGTNVPILDMPINSLEVDNWKEFEDKVQNELKHGVVRYPGTAVAGEIGNTFLTGHSSYYPWDDGRYKDVFARLGQLDLGDEYYIFRNQKKYKYKVVEKKEVNPSNISVLKQPSDKKVSTLMTCTPIGTNLRRLIIVSELI